LIGTLDDLSSSSVESSTFNINIVSGESTAFVVSANTAPTLSPAPSDKIVNAAETSTLSLGSVVDLESDNVDIVCTVNPNPLLVCDSGSLLITITSTDAADAGTYAVEVVLTDDNSDGIKSTTYNFNIEIKAIEEESEEEEEEEEEVSDEST